MLSVPAGDVVVKFQHAPPGANDGDELRRLGFVGVSIMVVGGPGNEELDCGHVGGAGGVVAKEEPRIRNRT